MLSFPNDHDVFLSIPCGIDGSRHSTEYISTFDEPEVFSEENTFQSNSQRLADLIPCCNSLLCLLRLFDEELSYSQLADLLGIHRANAKRCVQKFLQQL